MKKKLDLQKILRCIFLALAIVSMLIAIATKVSAEEYINNFDNIFDVVAQSSNVSNSDFDYISNYLLDKNIKHYAYITRSENTSALFFTSLDDIIIDGYISGSTFYTYIRYPYYISQLSNNTAIYYVLFIAPNSNYGFFEYKINGIYSPGNFTYNNTVYYGFTAEGNKILGENLNSINLPYGINYYVSDLNFDFIYRDSTAYNTYNYQNLAEVVPPEDPVVVNSKFKIYSTFGSAGISDPILHIEYNDTLFDAGYTYTSFTQYDLTFEVDGETVVYSADSDQFPDDFFTAEYNSGFRVPYEYIYEMLSDQLFNFSEASSVKLVQVDMTATAYPDLAQLGTPQTKTASTLCSLNLKGYDLAPEYDDDSPAEISDKTLVYDQVVDSNDYINHSGQFNSANIPSWANMVTIIVYNDPVGQNFNAPFSCDLYINDDILKSFSFSGYTDPNYIITSSTGTVIDYDHLVLNKAYLSEFIIVSKLLDSADCVHFISGDYDGNGTWTTYDSYLFINQSYYQKLTIKGIGNLQSAVEAGSYYIKGLYTYVYNKLNSMADNSITYYTNSFTALQEQKSILGSINSGLLSVKDTISSGTDRIVNAIGSISSGGSSYNLPSLSNEIQRLFIPSLSWESIDFDEYIDSLGVLGLPFTSTNDVLMATRSNYSPDFEIHINDFKPTILGETFTVFEDQDFSFNPRRIFSLEIWTTLQYLNAFVLILGEAWFTYCHIFRREKDDC